jgi:hypothetical protein
MWALQSGQFILNWQFSFDKQVNWPAAEANWALMVRGETSAQEWDIVRAAMFNSRSADPGGWAHDCYEDDDMERLATKATELREEMNEDRVQRMIDAEANSGGGFSPHPTARPVQRASSASDPYDLGRLAAQLNSVVVENEPANFEVVVERGVDDDVGFFAPAGGLPVYAEARARSLAEAPESSDDGDAVREREKQRARERKYFRRYIDDEAEEEDDDAE